MSENPKHTGVDKQTGGASPADLNVTSSRRLLIVGAVAVMGVIAAVVLLLWSRRTPKPALVETPPTLESQKEGGKEDGHSQEGVIEVSDETAELVGIKTEPATRGEIE